MQTLKRTTMIAQRVMGMRAMQQASIMPQQMRMYSMLAMQMKQTKSIYGYNAMRAFSFVNPPSSGLYL
mgnify:CR=1 FL=1